LSLFRRAEPLHVRLAREGGLDAVGEVSETPPAPWDAAGIHGNHRVRGWDAVTTIEAPELGGEGATFVSLTGGRRVVLDGDTDVEPLAAAIDHDLAAPYRAEAVRRKGALWVIGGWKIETVTLPGTDGDEIELSSHDGERTLVVDGEHVFGSIPALERPEHVVRARRIVEDVWEVEVHPL
jgi:hypothetical protein